MCSKTSNRLHSPYLKKDHYYRENLQLVKIHKKRIQNKNYYRRTNNHSDHY